MTEPSARCSLTRALSFHARHRFASGGPPTDHGHLYRVEVTVAGDIRPGRPSVIDLATLDGVLTREVADPLAGRHLNEAIPELAAAGQEPTCEAVAAWCWRRIAPRLPPGTQLERVRVAEDATLWADCSGVD